MKALMLEGYGNFEIAQIPKPELSNNDLLVRVKSCAICGSDVHGYDGSSGRRIPPIVMGHEAAGVIEAVGDDVVRFKVGDRVTFDSTVYCGECDFCRAGQVNLCDNRMVVGVSCDDYRRHGAFAEYVSVPERILYTLPDSLSFDSAALIEAVSVAIHAVARVGAKKGDSAVVVGAGMIGLLIVQVLRHKGCSPIIAVDIDDSRLELARKFGADVVLNASNTNVPDQVIELTNGHGANIALEAVGATQTINTAIESVRKGASICLIGNISLTVDLPLQSVVTRELTIFGTCASQGEYPECIELMSSGIIDVEPLISARAPLEEGQSWFDRLHAREPGLMKVVLNP